MNSISSNPCSVKRKSFGLKSLPPALTFKEIESGRILYDSNYMGSDHENLSVLK